jgi:tetratricopeptide (TPR) repeat protein
MEQRSDKIVREDRAPETDVSRVFVGRERELGELRAGLEIAISGRGRLFLVAGEPGIGKTRLLGELAAHAPRREARVLWGRCWEGEGAPAYWPWVQIVRSHVRIHDAERLRSEMGAGAADIAQIVPEVYERLPGLTPPTPIAEPEHARFRLFDSITAFFKNAAQADPLVVILDDLHCADKASLLLLQFLAREMAESHLLVVGAYRDVEVQRGHPIIDALVALRREPVHERILLRGLSEREVAALLGALGGEGAPAAFVKLLCRETEGNPFFIEEILEHLIEEGIVERERGRWKSRLAPDEMRIPESVREVIGRRLNRLSKECNDLLALASVIGREFEQETLEPLADLSSDRLQELLEEAMRARVVEDVPRAVGRYSFSHNLIRETLYGELRAPRRVVLHRRIAEVLAELQGRDPEAHLPALAYHFFEAAQAGGDVDKAIAYAERAGVRATKLLAYDEAAAHYERALELLDLKPPDDSRRYDLLLALGEALDRSGDIVRGHEAFEKGADVARRTRAPEKLARAVLLRCGRGATDPNSKRLVDEALNALGEEDSGLRAQLLSRLITGLWYTPAEADAVERRAIEMARRVGDREAITYVLGVWGRSGQYTTESDDEAAVAAEAIRVARESGDEEALLSASLRQVAVLLRAGRIEEADAAIESSTRRAEELRQPLYVWWAMMFRPMRAILDGGLDEAERLSLETVAMGRRMHDPMAILTTGGQLFQLRWDQGRLGEMEVPLARTVHRYPYLHSLRCNLAFLYAEMGQDADARKIFEELARNGFSEVVSRRGSTVAACWLAEACALLEDAPRAAVLYEILLPYAGRVHVIAPYATSCVGSVSRQLGLLATVMSRWEDAERHFEDALEMHARMRARPFLARTRYEYARMLLARGQPADREKAHDLLDQALAAAEELGMKTVTERAAALLSEVKETGGAREPSAAAVTLSQAEILRRDGDYWTVCYEGAVFRLRDTKGLHYLAHLLRHPREEFHVADLVAAVGGQAEDATDSRSESATPDLARATSLGDAGELLDPQARTEYKQRLEDLRAELEQATEWGDTERAGRLQEEIQFISEELSAAYGLGGRSRKGADTAERIRKAVSNRIRDTIARIEKENRALGEHLAEAVRMGAFCSYSPKRSGRRI